MDAPHFKAQSRESFTHPAHDLLLARSPPHTTLLQALSQAVLEAAQEAHATSVKGMQEKMAGLAKSLGLPSP